MEMDISLCDLKRNTGGSIKGEFVYMIKILRNSKRACFIAKLTLNENWETLIFKIF